MTQISRLILTLVLASACSAASWDGTKGNITISTTSTPISTAISISSSDSSYNQFAVIVAYKNAVDDVAMHLMTALSTRTFTSRDSKGEARVLLPVPEDRILWLSITEIRPGETQTFSRTN